jgi:bifunctional non-homologous end joining protein LigD
VVIFKPDGRSSFQSLQNAIGNRKSTFTFVAFDLIYLDGLDLTRVALEQRKQLLEGLFKSLEKPNHLRYSDHVEGNGRLFLSHACKAGVEGIVAKLRTAVYESGRNRNWLKVKCERREEFVIAGYTTSSAGLPGFGALILGVYKDARLVYAGRVGTGFTMKQRVEFQKRLARFSRDAAPFDSHPRDLALSEANWVEPTLKAEVGFTEWTAEGTLRHPSFKKLVE